MALPEDDDRHQIYLAKLATGLLNSEVYPSMDAAYRAIRAALLDAEELNTERKMVQVMNASGKIIKEEYGGGLAGLTKGLEEMAIYEAGFYASLLAQYSDAKYSTPAKKDVLSFINKSIMTLQSGKRINAGVWADYVQGAIESQAKAINGAIVAGYQQGRTVNQISRDIRDLYNGILVQEAEALARTGQAHYALSAREAMAEANPQIKYRVYQATFDNRTSLGCRALHGKSWPIASNDYVRLPRHFNCRSVYLFVESLDQAKRGEQPSVGGKQAEKINPNRKLKYRGKRDTDIFKPERISAAETQDAWLRDQPDWFIESALGKTRAKLFKDGKMNIKKFTDMTGEQINLDDLRRLDAEAFERAGL